MTETAKEFIKRKEEELPRKIKIKDIGREGIHWWNITKRACMQQTGHPEKVFVFERLERAETEGKLANKMTGKEGDIEYRIGYYIVGKIRKANGRWVWGQFCPFIPEEDFDKLIQLAKDKGVISV